MATTYRITTFGIAAGRPQGPARAVLAGLLQGDADAIDALVHRVLSGERVTLAEEIELAEHIPVSELDDGKAHVHGAFTTGIGYSKGYGSSTYNGRSGSIKGCERGPCQPSACNSNVYSPH